MSQQSTPQLNWLFVAFFDDGSVIKQTQEDKSITEPGKSAHYDVRTSDKKLIAFELRHVDGDKVVTVDMVTGAFIVNGIPLHAHNQSFEPERYDLKHIYFLETQIQRDAKHTVNEDMSVSQEFIGEPRHYVNRYFMGWETEVNGKNKQLTLAVG